MCNKTNPKESPKPDPKMLGSGMANKAAKELKGRKKRLGLALKEAGAE